MPFCSSLELLGWNFLSNIIKEAHLRPGVLFYLTGWSAAEHKTVNIILQLHFESNPRRAIPITEPSSEGRTSPIFVCEQVFFLRGPRDFCCDYLANKGSHEMSDSSKYFLLPVEVTVFLLPCKQQVLDDQSLYGHLNTLGTSLQRGRWIVRLGAELHNGNGASQGWRSKGELMQMDIMLCSSVQPVPSGVQQPLDWARDIALHWPTLLHGLLPSWNLQWSTSLWSTGTWGYVLSSTPTPWCPCFRSMCTFVGDKEIDA